MDAIHEEMKNIDNFMKNEFPLGHIQNPSMIDPNQMFPGKSYNEYD